jgi:NADPH-dependent ferric siderophore reductase
VPRPFPARTGVAHVARVAPITPHMTRIVLAGPALDDFFVEEPGEIVTLLWAQPGREVVLPEGGWRFPPGVADAQHARNYTVRHWDAGARELHVDFVLHGDEGQASRWAAAAKPGDAVGFAGPRVHWSSATPGDWTVLVADETGLPALAAIAEGLPPGHPAIALVEVSDEAEEQTIESPGDLDLRWLHRGGGHAGTGSPIPAALRALDLPDGAGRAWGGGESTAMAKVRRHLKERRGLMPDAMSVLGYWKYRPAEAAASS